MALRNLVVLALIFFALVGMAAASSAEAPATASDGAGEVTDGSDHDLIGTVDDDGDDAAPVGAPVSEGTFPKAPSSTPSDAPSFKATTGLGATIVAITAAGFFF